jgi:hypothetical protein
MIWWKWAVIIALELAFIGLGIYTIWYLRRHPFRRTMNTKDDDSKNGSDTLNRP